MIAESESNSREEIPSGDELFGDNYISAWCCINRKGYRNLACENACQQMEFNSDLGLCDKPSPYEVP